MNNKVLHCISFTLYILTVFAGNIYSLPVGKSGMTVVIDPGHGGNDPGAVNKKIYEKTIVLNIGLRLGELIKSNYPDVNVIYTRDKDVFVPLYERAAIANKNKADVFISIHANSCKSALLSGAETFVLGLHSSEENLEVAKKENSVILMEDDYSQRYEGFDPNSSESYIMFELIQDEFLEQSVSLANKVQEQFRIHAERKDRGVKQAGFLVLRQTSMPSILIETGFLSHPDETKYLISEKGQENLANSVFKAFKEYKSMIEARSEFTNDDSLIKKDTNTTLKVIENPVKTVSNRGISFAVQIAASQKDIKTVPANFHGLSNIKKVKSGNLYKYFCGNETDYEAIKLINERVKKKYPGCFIVAFKNGKTIPLSEALK